MRAYIGTKIISAEPQDKDGAPGYKVVYPDNYVSWSPKAVFEEAYRPISDGERGLIEQHNPLQEIVDENAIDFKTTRVASEKEVGIDEPVETGGHDIDRDGPIPFDG